MDDKENRSSLDYSDSELEERETNTYLSNAISSVVNTIIDGFEETEEDKTVNSLVSCTIEAALRETSIEIYNELEALKIKKNVDETFNTQHVQRISEDQGSDSPYKKHIDDFAQYLKHEKSPSESHDDTDNNEQVVENMDPVEEGDIVAKVTLTDDQQDDLDEKKADMYLSMLLGQPKQIRFVSKPTSFESPFRNSGNDPWVNDTIEQWKHISPEMSTKIQKMIPVTVSSLTESDLMQPKPGTVYSTLRSLSTESAASTAPQPANSKMKKARNNKPINVALYKTMSASQNSDLRHERNNDNVITSTPYSKGNSVLELTTMFNNYNYFKSLERRSPTKPVSEYPFKFTVTFPPRIRL